jgi:hypothetical protein
MNKLIIAYFIPIICLVSCPSSNPTFTPIGTPSSTASIEGSYKSSTPVQIEGYNNRNLDTEISLSVSGNQIKGSAVYIEVNPPPTNFTYRAPARILTGIRSGSQVTFNQVFSECNGAGVSLTGTVQPNSDIRFGASTSTMSCPKSAPVPIKVTHSEFTLVKQ